MKLADYDKHSGVDWPYEYKGLRYPDATGLIQTGFLGFCGCGDEDDNLAYILRGLELIAEKLPDDADPMPWYRQHNKDAISAFGSEVALSFFYYWADTAGLTEHGPSVHASWLTVHGKDILSLLRDWQEKEDDNEKGAE